MPKKQNKSKPNKNKSLCLPTHEPPTFTHSQINYTDTILLVLPRDEFVAIAIISLDHMLFCNFTGL